MNNNDINKEFEDIIKPIIDNEEFRKLKSVSHHGISRFDHSLRVAYFSYRISKLLHLSYKETAEAALLHDFFVDEVDDENGLFKLRRHPEHAVNNASKHFDLTDRQKDIIKTHMFPITFTPPKYIESWIVDIVDDFSAVYERYYSLKKEMRAATSFMLILLVNIIRMR